LLQGENGKQMGGTGVAHFNRSPVAGFCTLPHAKNERGAATVAVSCYYRDPTTFSKSQGLGDAFYPTQASSHPTTSRLRERSAFDAHVDDSRISTIDIISAGKPKHLRGVTDCKGIYIMGLQRLSACARGLSQVWETTLTASHRISPRL
jgi:hypothetical protein